MTWECNPWSDIKWNQRRMFLFAEHNSALQFWWRQWDVSDTQNIIHHSTSDISLVLSKQVRCRDPRGKRLVTGSNLPSVLMYIKPMRFTIEDGSRTNVKCEHTATGLLLKNYRGDMCGQSGEEWPQGWMVLSSTRCASTIILCYSSVFFSNCDENSIHSIAPLIYNAKNMVMTVEMSTKPIW